MLSKRICYAVGMRMLSRSVMVPFLLGAALAGEGHVIAWGAWKPITSVSGQQIKIRPLVIDGRVKEYATGDLHQVTETLTVARRVFRVNNALPTETAKNPQWVWEVGGWMSVNSRTGHISDLKLPEFDNHNSEASWFQDYAAYCGTAEQGNVHYMVVSQFGKRRPLLRKVLSGRSCPAPVWDKEPTRVTFETADGRKIIFAIHDNVAELQSK